jgi:glycosyltransferase involved in cell wall biosynthesis
MTMAKKFSIIIEWENAKLSELSRAKEMLRVIHQQVEPYVQNPSTSRPGAPELLIVYDEGHIDATIIHSCIKEAFGGEPRFDVRLVPAPDLGYYGLKVFGAEQATNEIIIFLDSDVVPLPGWLDALLASFSSPDIFISGGDTKIVRETLYERAFASFWFFAERETRSGVWDSGAFYANNFIIRRADFLANPFPETEAFRGSCLMLTDRLRAQNKRIVTQGDAQVTHPPPSDFTHFLIRAVCEGHDAQVLMTADRLGHNQQKWIMAIKRLRWNLRDAFSRIRKYRQAYKQKFIEVVSSFGLATIYYLGFFAGDFVTAFSPKLIRNNLSI